MIYMYNAMIKQGLSFRGTSKIGIVNYQKLHMTTPCKNDMIHNDICTHKVYPINDAHGLVVICFAWITSSAPSDQCGLFCPTIHENKALNKYCQIHYIDLQSIVIRLQSQAMMHIEIAQTY